MCRYEHIQYPVGQGGFHLCIIGNYAYVYDCGSYGKNVDWNNIFDDAKKQLAECEKIDIFISHFHTDHYNKLADFIKYILKEIKTINVKIYTPQISPKEKVFLIVDYAMKEEDKDNIDSGDIEYDLSRYIKTVVFEDFNIKENKEIKHIHLPHGGFDISIPKYMLFGRRRGQLPHGGFDISIPYDVILRTYVTNISDEVINKLFNTDDELKNKYEEILDAIKNKDTDKIEKFVRGYIEKSKISLKSLSKNVHKNMLTLCCVKYPQYLCCCNKTNSWLHTGDAILQGKKLKDFIDRFYDLLPFVKFVQIPHHGSKDNHDKMFTIFLVGCNTLFCTVNEIPSKSRKIVKPHLEDISIYSCNHYNIRKVSEDIFSRINY